MIIKQSTNFNYEKYRAYIASSVWKKKAALVRRLDEHTCQICNFRKGKLGLRPESEFLEVHHLTYQRLFCEWTIDLVTLCQACHGDITAERKSGKSLDEALELVCLRFGLTGAEVKLKLEARSTSNASAIATEKFFTPKSKTAKKRSRRKKQKQLKQQAITHNKPVSRTYVFGVSGLGRSGVFYDEKSAKKACERNRLGKCERFDSRKDAEIWINQRSKQLRPSVRKTHPGYLNLVNDGQRLVING